MPGTRRSDERLQTYRSMRDAAATPEPFGAAKRKPRTKQPRFVVQEHHARALHWDFRLERDGVLVSWAVPKGLPVDPKENRLAVHTEDHPLDYFDFEGEIPAGEYGGGQVKLWDQGTYEVEKWRDDEVMVVLSGQRVSGRYVLFQTRGRNWMMHRMDPPADPDFTPLPDDVPPMLAVAGTLPRDDGNWGYEFKWDGVRVTAYVEGGRVRLVSRNGLDATKTYPELRELGARVGARQVVLDGEVVAFDADNRPSFERLQARMRVTTESRVRRLVTEVPIVYLVFDLLHLDGRSTLELPYRDRRTLLDELALAGPHWQTPPWFEGGGAAILQASADQGLEGVLAKRLDSPYQPGRRSDCWVKVKNTRRQEVVVGGWTEGEGSRAPDFGALLVGVWQGDRFVYVGKVGTGFNARTLKELLAEMRPLEQRESPFDNAVPKAFASRATWLRPELVAEVEFAEWTRDGKLRHPSYKGRRFDKDARDVVREDVG